MLDNSMVVCKRSPEGNEKNWLKKHLQLVTYHCDLPNTTTLLDGWETRFVAPWLPIVHREYVGNMNSVLPQVRSLAFAPSVKTTG